MEERCDAQDPLRQPRLFPPDYKIEEEDLEDAIALTEKKVAMTLDDLIKMSKKAAAREKKCARLPIKGRGLPNGNASRGNGRVQHYMDSRSSIRQGVLAHRRSNFHGNSQFPVATQIMSKAINMPTHYRVGNRKRRAVNTTVQGKTTADCSSDGKDKVVNTWRLQTLDARFATLKEQRMRTISQQSHHGNELQTARGQRNLLRRGRGPNAPKGTAQGLGKFVR